jgi:DNA-nicking Smr family endonuclease
MADPDFLANPIAVPISENLDLHTFAPRDLGGLIPEYLRCCREAGILRVRLVHGKGTGTLRTTVHALLARLPEVVSFSLASAAEGGWGATWVTLRSVA